jgi:hypothetical protein
MSEKDKDSLPSDAKWLKSRGVRYARNGDKIEAEHVGDEEEVDDDGRVVPHDRRPVDGSTNPVTDPP